MDRGPESGEVEVSCEPRAFILGAGPPESPLSPFSLIPSSLSLLGPPFFKAVHFLSQSLSCNSSSVSSPTCQAVPAPTPRPCSAPHSSGLDVHSLSSLRFILKANVRNDQVKNISMPEELLLKMLDIIIVPPGKEPHSKCLLKFCSRNENI